jgi:3-isopropylmalate dehydratase small subunit
VFGDHVSTDTITPGRFNVTTDAAELARAAFCESRPTFRDEVRRGDVVVAGANFGCGSSRESAPRALHASGIAGVVAESYARIFYRNAVSIGLPVYLARDVTSLVGDGDEVELRDGILHTKGGAIELTGATGFLADVLAAGGILSYVRARGVDL